MKNIFRFLAVSIFFATSSYFHAHATYITTSVDRDSFTVGDPVTLSIALIVPPKAKVVAPAFEKSGSGLVFQNTTSSKTERKSSDSLLYRILVTSYTVEPCTILALQFVVTSPQRAETLYSETKPLKVISLVNSDTAAIKGLKSQQSAGLMPLYWLWFLLFIGALVIGAWLLKRYARRKEKIVEIPPLPPYEEALAALERLAAKQLLAKGFFREHVFELSEIFKRYIGRRFMVNAAEFTTQEMLAWIQESTIESMPRKSTEWFFTTTDPIKFAKLIPERDIVERLDREVRAFLEQTRPSQQPDSASAGALVLSSAAPAQVKEKKHAV